MGDGLQAELAFNYLKVCTNMNYFQLPVKSILAGLGMLHMFSLVSVHSKLNNCVYGEDVLANGGC
jgi:hypothetical protein